LEQHRARFEKEGLKVVAMGLGEPKHAAYFGPRLAPSVACLSWATPEAHSAYGIGRASLGSLAQPGLAAAAVRAVAGGHVQGKATGDSRVLSGTFLIDSTGVIRFAHYARFPGDDPAIDDILAAAAALPSEVRS
jgi:hypothetical protein